MDIGVNHEVNYQMDTDINYRVDIEGNNSSNT